MTNTKNLEISTLTVAHIIVVVSDLEASCRFYTEIGLPAYAVYGGEVANIELNGGTHLLLYKPSGEKNEDVLQSTTGQYRRRFSEQFDLMIPGRSREDLEAYRQGLISRGIVAGEIPDEKFYGHHLFCIKDPDGHGITIYTSHRISG